MRRIYHRNSLNNLLLKYRKLRLLILLSKKLNWSSQILVKKRLFLIKINGLTVKTKKLTKSTESNLKINSSPILQHLKKASILSKNKYKPNTQSKTKLQHNSHKILSFRTKIISVIK